MIAPSRGHGVLFDHLVGASEERGRDGDAEGFGSFGVDGQLELDRTLNGQFAWISSLQNAINIYSRPMKWVEDVQTIRH
jgi:hypothetical protein